MAFNDPIAELLTKIRNAKGAQHRYVDLGFSKIKIKLLEIMKNQRHRARLALTLPPGWQIAHKTGLLRHACHDVAVVYGPEGDYVLAVLTWKGLSYHDAKNYIAKLGRITYKYYGGESEVATSRKNTFQRI